MENEDRLSEMLMTKYAIEEFATLQYLKNAKDVEKELDYMIKVSRKKLEVLGVDVSLLER